MFKNATTSFRARIGRRPVKRTPIRSPKKQTKRTFTSGGGSELGLISVVTGLCVAIAGAVGLNKDESNDQLDANKAENKPIRREAIQPRPGWEKICEEQGLTYHTEYGKWWDESHYYIINADGADQIREATKTIHEMCLQAVGKVVNDDKLLKEFEIPEELWSTFRQSWNNKDPSLYGRMDLMFDGVSPPKFLEYNADTPTLLLESGIVQNLWWKQQFKGANYSQVNELDEALKKSWIDLYEKIEKTGETEKTCHFAFVRDNEEDLRNAQYVAACAQNAGFESRVLYMDQIKWNEDHFEDPSGGKIERLWKLYPWEWILVDLKAHMPSSEIHRKTQWLEPPWKLILSNKAILCVLWDMFPDHKNLLPSYFSPEPLREKNLPIITKLAAGREGANIAVRNSHGDVIFDTEVPHDMYQVFNDNQKKSQKTVDENEECWPLEAPMGRAVYQQWVQPVFYSSFTPVISSWIVNNEPAGIVIREDKTMITNNKSTVIPHVVDIGTRSLTARAFYLLGICSSSFNYAWQAVPQSVKDLVNHANPYLNSFAASFKPEYVAQSMDPFWIPEQVPEKVNIIPIKSFVGEDEKAFASLTGVGIPTVFAMGAKGGREENEEERRKRKAASG